VGWGTEFRMPKSPFPDLERSAGSASEIIANTCISNNYHLHYQYVWP
jgi:hypothetical protein